MNAGALLAAGLLLPMAGFIYCRGLGRDDPRTVRVIAPAAVGAAFLAILVAGLLNGPVPRDYTVYQWLLHSGGAVAVPAVAMDLYLDPLSIVMGLVITGVGFLIHFYAAAYMEDEGPGDYARFFGHMNLFIFSMLLLVLAHNFVFLTIGWAMVGLSSYLLIGFWNARPAAVSAARKAFVMNVIGDVGIVLASFAAYINVGSLDFSALFGRTQFLSSGTLELIAFLLLLGAVAKSAQVPLHTWLPDAMEGPTPVSALIHAATMVTAGVYLLARFQPLFHVATAAATTAALLALVTALMAASIACVQTDIKRVLAYSTMSQVGYMFFAVSIGAEVAGIFHLVTHAFFKALLFLAAGNVIHALHGEQDLRRMGGLWKELPVTGWAFLVGTLALVGIPPLSGFFSKDAIVSSAFASGPLHPLTGVLLVAVAGLTAYYMLRAFNLAFVGAPAAGRARVHEGGSLLQLPVIALAALAAGAGLLQPGPWHILGDFLGRAVGRGTESASPFVVLLTLAAAGTGLVVASTRFGRSGSHREAIHAPDGLLGRAFYWDDLYRVIVVDPLMALGGLLAGVFEPKVIGGAAQLATRAANGLGTEVRRIQSGYLRSYAMLFAAGALAVVLAAGLLSR